MKKNTKIFINIALIAIILVCLFIICYKLLQYYRDGKNYSKVQILKPKIQLENKGNSDENKLKEINSDYKMWISIPGTNINYPVVQGKDNEFYLHNNFYKEKSDSGTLFIDYRNNIASDKNIIIYGHNMKNGTMFNKINDFKRREDFNNGVVKLIRNNIEYTYEVFSVFVADENYTDFKCNFASDEKYEDYIKLLKQKSLFNKNIDINSKGEILTLYTCSYEFNGARTIVCAVRVK